MITHEPQEEHHPLVPFLPENAKILLLGSFPPKKDKWSMDFFYPNFQNDMWRIMGFIFFDDKNYFIVENGQRFCLDQVVAFCTTKGIAIYDTASAVKRLKDNASDKFLDITKPTDITKLLEQLPHCQAVVTTGQKATEVVTEKLGCQTPKLGEGNAVVFNDRNLLFYRMPSSSRAYPLALDKKAAFYRAMFHELGVI